MLPEIVKLLIFSFSSVAFLFIISKFSGKKQIAQLEFVDYAIGISIGSIAAEMATDLGDNPFYYYLIAMAVFFLFDIAVSLFGRKGPFLKHFLKGRPLIIIYEGKINYNNLRRSKLAINELISMCRESGYFNLDQIAYAIFENSGKLSLMPKSSQKPVVAEDMKIKLPQASLTNYLVIDGKISYSGLTELNKDEKWLFNELNIKNKKQLKNIILATYDDKVKKVKSYSKTD